MADSGRPYVAVDHLSVVGRQEGGAAVAILSDVSFAIARGEVLALIGESGSGKTTAALSLMGYARAGCRITAGRVRLGETDVLALPPHKLADLRGRQISYVAQSAAAAFNPAQRIMGQVIEPALIHGVMSRADVEAKARALFAALALPDPDRVGERYPHQVSGGQLQRLMAAMALITGPELVILDEPTTALDVTTQIEVLRAFRHVVRELNTTAVYVSHDLAVVAQLADRVVVLQSGRVQETAPIRRVLIEAEHPYTRSLIAAAAPSVKAAPAPAVESPAPLLEVSGLLAGYGGLERTGQPRIPIVHDISFDISAGSVLGVIGESGCGKSTLARVIAGLLPAARGALRMNGKDLPRRVEDRSKQELRAIQIVFQMADVALNPARTVAAILARPLLFYHGMRGEQARRRVRELLEMVRLSRELATRYPDELSGGQKQRVNLARALAAEPSLILCDEVTSALDTVVAAAVLELLAELRRELGVAMMFISHDLSTVRAICDQVMVLYAGMCVEAGPRSALQQAPWHPYTRVLLASVPELRTDWLDSIGPGFTDGGSAGLAPEDLRRPCPFYRRCPVRIPGTCDVEPPPELRLSKGVVIACHQTESRLSGASGQGLDDSAQARAFSVGVSGSL
jgi:peptide/nickel transport system ATP-binding protein